MVQYFGVQIFRSEYQLFRIKNFRTDNSQDETLKGHAVVSKKAAQGKGKRGQDTHPADFSGTHYVAQTEVHAHRHQDSQQGEQELPQGQAEEQAFLLVPDFFVDTDFYGYHFFHFVIN